VSANAGTPYQSTPELDMISKEIAELALEKHVLETDIAQKEADIKIKSGEVKSLQVCFLNIYFFMHNTNLLLIRVSWTLLQQL